MIVTVLKVMVRLSATTSTIENAMGMRKMVTDRRRADVEARLVAATVTNLETNGQRKITNRRHTPSTRTTTKTTAPNSDWFGQ